MPSHTLTYTHTYRKMRGLQRATELGGAGLFVLTNLFVGARSTEKCKRKHPLLRESALDAWQQGCSILGEVIV